MICGDASLGEGTNAARPAGVMLRSRLGRFKVEGTGIGVFDCFPDDTPCSEAFGVASFEAWAGGDTFDDDAFGVKSFVACAGGDTFEDEAFGVVDFDGGKILVGGLIGVSLRSWISKETFLFNFAGGKGI